jgi:hypothetical protein
MEEFSRPATLEDLKLLLRSLNEHGADCLLIGGYALAAHGYLRATTDIDLLVPGTVQAGRRTKDALMVLPDRAAKEIEPEWFEEAGTSGLPTHLSSTSCQMPTARPSIRCADLLKQLISTASPSARSTFKDCF